MNNTAPLGCVAINESWTRIENKYASNAIIMAINVGRRMVMVSAMGFNFVCYFGCYVIQFYWTLPVFFDVSVLLDGNPKSVMHS